MEGGWMVEVWKQKILGLAEEFEEDDLKEV
jgi:hypothetical protein